MRFLSYKSLLIAYIVLMCVIAIASVGEEKNLDPPFFEWTIVPKFMMVLLIPVVLGYLAGKDRREIKKMTHNKCEHRWITNSGKGGAPVFRLNTQMGRNPIMHTQCLICGDRTWFTSDQWDSRMGGKGDFTVKLDDLLFKEATKNSIHVGEYTISKMENGNYWIAHSDGEGMEARKEIFEDLIHTFYSIKF